jgi:hypothetical protein
MAASTLVASKMARKYRVQASCGARAYLPRKKALSDETAARRLARPFVRDGFARVEGAIRSGHRARTASVSAL